MIYLYIWIEIPAQIDASDENPVAAAAYLSRTSKILYEAL
jgi:hypothetical protein